MSSPAPVDQLEHDLRWVDETGELEKLKAELGGALDDLPADIASDVALARFIRGRREKLTPDFVRSALSYRRELIQQEDVAAYRASISADAFPNRANNPYIAEGVEGRTALEWCGWAKDGMPVRSVSVRALLNAARAGPDEATAMKASDLEEEASMLFLHLCSEKQQKMVKSWVVVDFCGASMTEVLSSIVPIVTKTSGKHSEHYVETTYRILLLNAPAMVSALVSAVSVALNARQASKIVICPAPTPLQDVAIRFQPGTVLNMLNALEASNPIDSMSSTLAPGQHEFVARRVPKGHLLKWSVEVDTDVLVSHTFITEESTPQAEEQRIEEHGTGTFTAPEDGVWCLCLNNYESWQATKQVDLNIAVIEM